LNRFAALSKSIQQGVRLQIKEIFSTEKHKDLPDGSVADIQDVEMHLPVTIGDFTDFSASKDHCLNASEAIFRQRNLPPAFLNFPIGYAGRASSIVVSGTAIKRPRGQFRSSDGVKFGLSQAMDFELEFGAIIGKPLTGSHNFNIADTEEHIFGFVLVNDWSARDIQGLEMNPLGPFNGKNFATSISPWVVVPEALEPFKVSAPARDQPVASYLDDQDSTIYSLDMQAEILIDGSSTVICRTNLKNMYWNFRHMIAHHTVGGCDLRTGDLVASGTVSGQGDLEHGCLLESTLGGKKELKLTHGSRRTYLQDGDVIRLTCRAMGVGVSGVGFGECIGELGRRQGLE